MLDELLKRKRMFLILVAISLLVSCSNSGYDTPPSATPSVISEDTLNGYVTAGKVNGTGYDKVVILDITSLATYMAGHIAGAIFINSADVTTPKRSEGVIYAVNMVMDGPTMDSLIQKAGIDKNTTIVFTGRGTSAGDYMSVGRVYFNFRYWGFPKERLKVLNGLNGAYKAKYGLTAGAPAPTYAPSSYSVRNNPSFRDDLRVSLQEMIQYADTQPSNIVVIDGRGGDGPGGGTFSYDGDPRKTAGVFSSPTASYYVAFEGHIKGATAMLWGDLYEGVDADGNGTTDYYRFKSEADMVPIWTAAGLDSTKTAYVHCRTGMISSAMFVALDAYLGWPVANYDGSWSQWGHLAGKENGGFLENDSFWRTDTAARTESLYLNKDAVDNVQWFIEDPSTGGAVNSYDYSANQIEEQDKVYFGAGGGSGSEGGGGKTPVGC